MPIHTLKGEGFSLSLDVRVFEEDLKSAPNTIVGVSVESGRLSFFCNMDIDVKQLAAFAKELKTCCERLEGSAVIKEPYGYEKYIKIKSDTTGHIWIDGYLCDDDKNHEVRFHDHSDQTFLMPFANELCASYSMTK